MSAAAAVPPFAVEGVGMEAAGVTLLSGTRVVGQSGSGTPSPLGTCNRPAILFPGTVRDDLLVALPGAGEDAMRRIRRRSTPDHRLAPLGRPADG